MSSAETEITLSLTGYLYDCDGLLGIKVVISNCFVLLVYLRDTTQTPIIAMHSCYKSVNFITWNFGLMQMNGSFLFSNT